MEITDTGERPYSAAPDVGRDIAEATLRVLSKRFGPEFARDVWREIIADADRLHARGDERGRAHAATIRENTLTDPIWSDLGVTG